MGAFHLIKITFIHVYDNIGLENELKESNLNKIQFKVVPWFFYMLSMFTLVALFFIIAPIIFPSFNSLNGLYVQRFS